ncbi:Diacylglycerol kinase [Caenorhabditis elegans]|nr:Diacylglycerol kinase [Caenorhabditis elegans]VAY52136.1 Diacylglycerol kinase [Caenorhabditis elegans]|eukprot:NP_001355416.1 Putative diacylglycerol kinase K06A1.6 [Caenorhabditis elegans]
MDGSSRAGSQEIVCDEFTKKLVAAITTWHDIHSSLLQLSIERSSNDSNEEHENVSVSSESSWSSASDSESDEDSATGRDSTNNHLSASAARFSISNPDLTNCQIKQMFPEMADHWRKALAKSPVVRRTAADQETSNPVNKHRSSRYWIEDEGDYHILPSEHVWLPSSTGSSASADSECYVGEKDCRRSGEKRRCAACHIVAHTNCFSLLAKLNLNCKTTFRDYATKKTPSKESTDGLTAHHWVHKWRHEGRCNTCAKSFQQKMFFQGKEKKETIAVTCSWCKESYHLKNCFARDKLEERCNRGALKEMIVPPTWILRLANRKRSSRTPSHPRKHKKSHRQFVVKPTDLWSSGPSQPLLVFVNPKSGGNKGSKALHTLCWLLNPRQVFDITSLKGPKFGLEMFRKVVTQLRILVCGGDGTVGWVLSTLDNLNWPAYPPMAIMPLGTGNDLARCMGWGGVFSDEPISQLMQAILHETIVTHLDRWRIDVEPNTSCNLEEEDDGMQSALPLTVMTNYFSIGADAHVALQFHHSRSANPQMLNSRLKNRIAYGGLGTIDLFKRSWKDLCEYITLECDGVDVTPRIKELKLHCILFHNITYYAGGTIPWGESSDNKPSCCDGKVEVLGFTTATLAALQMGGKGERIAQCSRVRVITNKAIPMQVDGEPCLLAPSIITLGFHSKVPMLKREKKTPCTPNLMRRGTRYGQKDSQVQSTSLIIQLPVIVVGRADYDNYKDCFERLKDTAYEIGIVNVESEAELDSARVLIQRLLVEHNSLPYEPDKNWRFLDYVSNAEEGTFRVSRQQEHVQSVSDVCNTDECLLILDHAFPSITDREAVELFQPQQPIPSTSTSAAPRYHNSRRISETLRIVLSSDAQETHL